MTNRKRSLGAVASLLLAASAGCDSGFVDPGPSPPPPAVSVAPATLRLGLNQGIQLQLNVSQALAGETVTWSSSNPAVAEVSATGMVRTIGLGFAVITATVGKESAVSRVAVLETAPCPVIFGFFVDC